MLQKGLPDEFFRIIFYGNMFFVGWVAGSRALYVEFGARIDGWCARDYPFFSLYTMVQYREKSMGLSDDFFATHE